MLKGFMQSLKHELALTFQSFRTLMDESVHGDAVPSTSGAGLSAATSSPTVVRKQQSSSNDLEENSGSDSDSEEGNSLREGK